MKFLTVAMMVFLLSLSVALISALDVMNGYNVNYQREWIDYVNSDAYKNQSYANAPFGSDNNAGSDIFTDFRVAFTVFKDTLFYATIGFGQMLENFGVPSILATLFALPVWLIYFIAFVQILIRFGFVGAN